MDAVREGEGGMNRESSIETYTLPSVKWIASGNLLYDGGSSNPRLCDYLERWDGIEGEGRIKRKGTYVYLWLIHVHIWQKPTQNCKAIILQLKINKI